jgi:hypothetical protein
MIPLKQTNEWPQLAVYDIEATDWVNVVCIGHVDELGNKKIFQSIELYIKWLFSPQFKGTHVWAHWGGHYDHRFIISYVTKLGWNWQTIQSGNLLIIIRVKDPSGREILFCESARLMPDSVEKIGKTVGLHKMEVDRSDIGSEDINKVYEYCLRDCEIVLRGLQYIKKTFTSVNCDFAYTLASISTRWVRRSDVLEWMRFYEKGPNGEWTYSSKMLIADEFCLPSYFGGRVEVFKAGTFKKKLYYYDITSSYPWSMTHELPTYFIDFFPAPKDKLERVLNYSGISEATVYIPRNTFNIPILPVRFEGKLIFPDGTFKGRWSNLELLELYKKGLRKGVKIQIHAQARYKPKAFLKPFVDMFYNLRKMAKEAKDEFSSYAYKILLNSLYGKLVENVERKSILHGSEIVNEAIKKHGHEKVIPTATPGIYALHTTSLGPFRHVAAGSYVTSYSRLRLLEGLQLCIQEGGKVYYCDTDSIVTDKPIKSFEAENNELGSFKLEYVLDEAEFVCPKVYRGITEDGKEIYKVKGMPIKGLTEDEKRIRWDLYNYHLNNVSKKRIDRMNLSHEKREFYSSKEGIAGFMTDLNKGNISPRKTLLQRQLQNPDSKRIHNGENSKPITLNFDEAI